ncbi:hypothetical protein G6F16_013904 [Rhizopus arrhizus]|nr:hypothetical protein G6F24_015452 [Rhizopus arrhizus]KAG0774766.1 hypothetical protein G6F21_014084 [Rhizopus arrhizus]KAG0777094.1 hypothetical protein G6F22_012110 [Rhizopus arrhizus]KAG0802915.1 hypothetical protein G6F20_013999 [Rhizopus arrhizus]KAG0805618.1 hypothetical protein G6F19_014048 [Rhizopus arrhizus]
MTSESFLPDLLRYCLRTLSQVPSHILPLVFPERRTPILKKFGCFTSLFRTFDQLDYKIDWSAFNAAMVEELPLTRICPDLVTAADGRKTRWSPLLVKDAYYFDHSCGLLRQTRILPTTRHRNKLLHYFELLRTGNIDVSIIHNSI